ncbi:MAG: TIGR00289 family protein [Candidatus Aenigmarchaeota archaeon ex4484_56]|nr:MAG: TIGR00289 family protein [Candidatus Aenigmarchaeota archaeon ex4484_56]
MNKKVGVLFSGGKDSCYALFLAKNFGYTISCLITIESENEESYMFHTPSICKVKKQAEVLGLPQIVQKTKGEKEKELEDLKTAIKAAKNKYGVEGIITGALKSEYQKSRIQKICDELKLECINPLWNKDQLELLKELIDNKFDVIITGVFAYPLDESYLGRKINTEFVKEIERLEKLYKINPCGEGGEYETFVLYCPLFSRKLKIINKKIFGDKNSFRMEIDVK